MTIRMGPGRDLAPGLPPQFDPQFVVRLARPIAGDAQLVELGARRPAVDVEQLKRGVVVGVEAVLAIDEVDLARTRPRRRPRLGAQLDEAAVAVSETVRVDLGDDPPFSRGQRLFPVLLGAPLAVGQARLVIRTFFHCGECGILRLNGTPLQRISVRHPTPPLEPAPGIH